MLDVRFGRVTMQLITSLSVASALSGDVTAVGASKPLLALRGGDARIWTGGCVAAAAGAHTWIAPRATLKVLGLDADDDAASIAKFAGAYQIVFAVAVLAPPAAAATYAYAAFLVHVLIHLQSVYPYWAMPVWYHGLWLAIACGLAAFPYKIPVWSHATLLPTAALCICAPQFAARWIAAFTKSSSNQVVAMWSYAGSVFLAIMAYLVGLMCGLSQARALAAAWLLKAACSIHFTVRWSDRIGMPKAGNYLWAALSLFFAGSALAGR